ncbi:protease inhibitor I42 family protein [Nocardia acidivorans]|uniref:protease inhibitor I42 family protein n=1 Tax=Nocardia acidivorans TaxID=404580 RepID=UPI00082CDC1F|nr:protease inhibitor I42 family protein [Nocardia acidivorans]
MRVCASLAVVLLGLALTACGDNGNPNEVRPTTTSSAARQAPEPVVAGRDQNGTDIALTVGQGLTVRLAANPSTGYMWQLAQLDRNMVEQTGGTEYEQDPSPNGMVGVGGTSIWKFTAKSTGATRLVLEYLRPWEQGVDPTERFTLNVNIT